ncbi:MgtC/SapB family protein [Microvirga pudoricolor]|uniref:MgtC/SapB family protein n=1 Tax=Microvirga pudoricolor TaxID=2778729 RepID=UPI00195058AB|nr:MgtC/SapB family protein [Microvirga pudoricolor]MBM6594395.1 MgtC/SapB family protein [Microvirga pudoricolor]
MQLSDLEMVGRLLLAAVLGSTIGFERERLLWAAGLRTHMLVAVGSCLIMIVSAFGFSDVLGTPNVSLDPSRIAAQVVSGIGFLGAGAILLRGEIIRGLTTAASLWTVAGIGLAVGGGLYLAATAATVIILVILVVLKPLEAWYRQKRQTVQIQIQAQHGAFTIDAVRQALGYRSDSVRQFISCQLDQSDTDEITVAFERISHDEAMHIAEQLRKLPAVKTVALV